MTLTNEELEKMLGDLLSDETTDNLTLDEDLTIKEFTLLEQLCSSPRTEFTADDLKFRILKDTKYSKPMYEKNETLRIAFTKEKGICKVSAIITDTEYRNLLKQKVISPDRDILSTVLWINTYIDLKNEMDEETKAYFESEITEPEHFGNNAIARLDDTQLLCYYRLTKSRYPAQAVSTLDSASKDGTISRGKERLFRTVLSVYDPTLRPKDRSSTTIRNAFRKTIQVYYSEEINQIANTIEQNASVGKGVAICLIGPEVLTQYFADSLKQALQIPTRTVDMNQCDDSIVLKGCDRSYGGAEAGVLGSDLSSNCTADMMMVFTNIDRCSDGGKGQRSSDFLDKLIKDRNLLDEFIDIDLPIEKATILCLAENRDRIRIPNLKDTFDEVVTLMPFDEMVKFFIADNELIPAIKARNSAYEDITIDTASLNYLVDKFCWDAGWIELERLLNKLFLEAAEVGVNTIDKSFIKSTMKSENNSSDPHLIAYQKRYGYSISVFESIQRLLSDYDHSNKDSATSKELIRKAQYMIHLCGSPDTNTLPKVTRNDFIEHLNRSHYGMKTVKTQMADYLQESKYSKQCFSITVLLDGDPGIGKSTIAEQIALAAKRPFVKIPLGGTWDSSIIKGNSMEPGLLADKLKDAGEHPVILLDEIDKVTDLMMSSLIELLDGSNGERTIFNHWLGEMINLSDAIIIATANDISKISSPIMNRFQYKIHIPDYSQKEKTEICRDYVLPQYLEHISGYQGTITFEPAAIEAIVKKHRAETGIRTVSAEVQEVVRHRIAESESAYEDIVIKKEDIPVEHDTDEMPVFDPVPGMANGVAVLTDGSGCLLQMKAVLLNEPGDTIITGLADQMAKETVLNGVTFIKMNYPERMKDRRFHVHFNDSSIQKSGPSGGLPILMAMLSAMSEECISGKSCFTGEIDPLGHVLPIGGLETKIIAAKECGIKTIYVPKANRSDVKKVSVRGIKVILTDDVKEVVKDELRGFSESDPKERMR